MHKIDNKESLDEIIKAADVARKVLRKYFRIQSFLERE